MNTCKHFLARCLWLSVLGTIGFGISAVAAATGIHDGEIAKPATDIATGVVPVHAPDSSESVDETALTPRAVIAVDDHWSRAELRGNTAWLRSLLLPGYRSTRVDGSVWDKSTLLANASKNRGRGQEKLKAFDDWLKAHPMNESVIIHGDVAILSFSDPKTGRVRLSNVFVYEQERWHALYSQLAGTE